MKEIINNTRVDIEHIERVSKIITKRKIQEGLGFIEIKNILVYATIKGIVEGFYETYPEEV